MCAAGIETVRAVGDWIGEKRSINVDVRIEMCVVKLHGLHDHIKIHSLLLLLRTVGRPLRSRKRPGVKCIGSQAVLKCVHRFIQIYMNEQQDAFLHCSFSMGQMAIKGQSRGSTCLTLSHVEELLCQRNKVFSSH